MCSAAVLQCCRLPIVLMSAVWFPSAALWGCRLSVSILQHCSQLSGWRAHTAALQHSTHPHQHFDTFLLGSDTGRGTTQPAASRRGGLMAARPQSSAAVLQCCRSSAAESTAILHVSRLYIYKCMIYFSTRCNKRTINIFPHTSTAALQHCSEQCCCVSAHRVPIMLQCCSATKHRTSRGGNINQIQTPFTIILTHWHLQTYKHTIGFWL